MCQMWAGYNAEDTLYYCISCGRDGILDVIYDYSAMKQALQAVRDSGGLFLDITDTEILAAMKFLAENTGVFGEPAGVTSLAGLRKALGAGVVTGKEKIVCMVTGSGLKDIKSAVQASGKALYVEPDIEALYRLIREDDGNA